MPRRASSSPHPLWWALAVGGLLIAAVAGHFIFKGVDDPYRTIPGLEVEAYLENSNSLRGNVYKMTGTVRNSLAWSPTEGRLYSFAVGSEILPVLIPADFNAINIQKGQQFRLRVEVGDRGILTAKDLSKV